MIELIGLTKTYGQKTAVNNLTCTIHPGHVTGFLGPNGSGKSTTMRMILGLDRPSAGTVLIDGQPFGRQTAPLAKIGAVLDAKSVPKQCSGRNYLIGLAKTHGLDRRRVDQVIELTGLAAVIGQRFRSYSLGMSQRLGIAACLLGDPEIVMMDEPVNGLDPEGVAWVRALAQRLAGEGRTVFLSSHLMSEMALTADHLLIIGQGRLLADLATDDFLRQSSEVATWVQSPQVGEIAAGLAGPGVHVTSSGPEEIVIHGLDNRAVGAYLAPHNWIITGLKPLTVSLEDAYLRLTDSSVEYRSVADWTA
ncbi:MAG: ATP-binding cassette domain-containing protein [Propionibacteriaceae bacterium]|jgi:ABC-2 type transport system ATP-binding protein|nr:ATP-binding cassette domain-containing protein [Propionibacteriaceae bacterium]